ALNPDMRARRRRRATSCSASQSSSLGQSSGDGVFDAAIRSPGYWSDICVRDWRTPTISHGGNSTLGEFCERVAAATRAPRGGSVAWTLGVALPGPEKLSVTHSRVRGPSSLLYAPASLVSFGGLHEPAPVRDSSRYSSSSSASR